MKVYLVVQENDNYYGEYAIDGAFSSLKKADKRANTLIIDKVTEGYNFSANWKIMTLEVE